MPSGSNARSTRWPTATAKADRAWCSIRPPAGGACRASAQTAAACAPLLNRPQNRGLSQAALETLAIIAYTDRWQRPDIARVRGVSADAGVAGLLERGLVEEAGRADTPGQPVLYRVTTAFSRMFGLKEGVASLPALSEFDLTDADHEALRARLHLVADQRAGAGLTAISRRPAWARAGRSSS